MSQTTWPYPDKRVWNRCVAPSVGHVEQYRTWSEEQPPSHVVANEVVHITEWLRGEPEGSDHSGPFIARC